MTPDQVDRAAQCLLAARQEHRALAALPEDCRPRSIEDGYRIQDALIARLAEPVAGWKIGATGAKVQRMLGVTEPFSGRLLAANVRPAPATIEADRLFMRGLEVEFAFRLGRDLPPGDGPYEATTVADAVASLHPAIEIIDCRYESLTEAGAAQLIADDGAHGAFVFADAPENWRDIDLRTQATTLSINGTEFSRGVGANVLGDPLRSLAWLATDRARRGDGLRAGEIITTGSTCEAIGWAEAGDGVEADFGTLGRVHLTFI